MWVLNGPFESNGGNFDCDCEHREGKYDFQGLLFILKCVFSRGYCSIALICYI